MPLHKGPESESQRFLSGDVTIVSTREIDGMGRYAGDQPLGSTFNFTARAEQGVAARLGISFISI